MAGRVVAVARDDVHRFSKTVVPEIELIAMQGVRGDAHKGTKVQHRSRVAVDPSQPNLRQVHLLASELFDELAGRGFSVGAGDLGENITTQGIDLIALPTGTLLKVGADAVIEVTGLRNPCAQIEAFQAGLLAEVLGRSAEGALVRKAGIMGIVQTGGMVGANAPISVCLPPHPHRPLERV